MLTDTQADISYEKALDALDLLIDDEDVSAKDRAAAERKRKRLTLVYIGKAIQDIEARTAKFQAFIGEMQDLIDRFDPATTVAAIGKLKSVVQEASQLVEAATGAIAVAPKGVAGRGGTKASPRAKPRAAVKTARRAQAGGAAKPPARKPAGAGKNAGSVKTAVRATKRAASAKSGAGAKAPTKATAGKSDPAPTAKRAGVKRRPAAPTRAGKARPARP